MTSKNTVPVAHVIKRLKEILERQKGTSAKISIFEVVEPYPRLAFNRLRAHHVLDTFVILTNNNVFGWSLTKREERNGRLFYCFERREVVREEMRRRRKTIVSARVDREAWEIAKEIVRRGVHRSLSELVDEAVRNYVLNYMLTDNTLSVKE